ncbi:MAG: Gfo/Idh/MocA family oxidoreductase [Prolixibacteraceae bacterium]|nr:Gfo/Idh/MocA family oxidoreductase [Prolixibacteraceae bacterium]
MSKEPENTSRRNFIKTTTAGLAAFTILPSSVVYGLGHPAPVSKLNIAAIGVGGVGFRNLTNLGNENIVALCDVDWDYGQKAFRRWSSAKRYHDFRVMFDTQKDIDAVVIATPDHTHSIAAMAAMQLQKHVFVQAPMAHSVFEMRRMNETARVFNVVTQVGNQSASGNEVREICELVWAGNIGEVKEVLAWTKQPHWKQGGFYPEKAAKLPRDLQWDLFLGPAPEIPYDPVYTPFGWRAWWCFGNGTLAAMGPHLLEPAFRALMLNAPVWVESSSTPVNLQSAPQAEKITFSFDRRDNLPRVAMPPVRLTWFDGGLLPDRPHNFPANLPMGNAEGGLLLIGTEGMLVCEPQGLNYKVIKNGEVLETTAARTLHRIADAFEGGHENDWVRACKETPENRLQPSAGFEKETALTETILVGTLAIRMQSLQRPLHWDSAQMKFKNIGADETFEVIKRSDFYLQNGMPKIDTAVEKHPATHFVDQTVRPVYRNGWKQI